MDWAGVSGKKTGAAIRAKSGIRAGPGSTQNTKKTLGKQGIRGNVEILVATEIPRNLTNTGEKGILAKMDFTWRRKSQKTYETNGK